MHNKKNLSGIITALCLFALSACVEAAPSQENQFNRPAASNYSNQPNNPNKQFDQKQAETRTEEKYDIMHRDENEDTDTLAIPLDDSEVEDEEEINRAENKNVFNLPSSRSAK